MPISTARAAARNRIVLAATDLLSDGGRDAVTTRSVSAAAGVQPPTIYRIFGDMDGLLDAVARQAFEDYLRDKHDLGETDDPVDDLRRSWDLHVEFGLTKPAFYILMYGGSADGKVSPLRDQAVARLRAMIARVAAVGRLRMSVERATALMYANGIGVVLTQIYQSPADRDPELPVVARDSIIRTITTETAQVSTAAVVSAQAAALRVALGEGSATGVHPLSSAETALLDDWLRRLADSAG
jgi:AcrR family transcriptional regulator